jgi:hypothetical protein
MFTCIGRYMQRPDFIYQPNICTQPNRLQCLVYNGMPNYCYYDASVLLVSVSCKPFIAVYVSVFFRD